MKILLCLLLVACSCETKSSSSVSFRKDVPKLKEPVKSVIAFAVEPEVVKQQQQLPVVIKKSEEFALFPEPSTSDPYSRRNQYLERDILFTEYVWEKQEGLITETWVLVQNRWFRISSSKRHF